MSQKRQAVVSYFACVGQATRAIARDEEGVAAIEYALLASLIAVIAAASIVTLGDRVEEIWVWISMQFSAAV